MLTEKRFFIAGVQHHEMHKVLKDLEEEDTLFLNPEPDNRFDPNAVRVEDADGTMLGYVPKKFSAEVAGALEIGTPLECTIIKLNKSGKPWEWCEVVIAEPSDESDLGDNDYEPRCPTCDKLIDECECEEPV